MNAHSASDFDPDWDFFAEWFSCSEQANCTGQVAFANATSQE
jgi:hypothetical protein